MDQEIIHTGQDIVPMDLLQRAFASGTDPAVWEKLMGLEERWQANQARKAFDRALAAAKAEFTEIKKSKTVKFATKMGRAQYSYEDLNDIARAVVPALSKYGMYYRWNTSFLGDQIIVTCIVCHRDGHSVENSLPGAADNSGGKNSVQATGSVCTYLQRYTLKAALGLASEEDDDAQAAGKDEETSSGGEYAARWQKILENATSAEDLKIKWNAEKLMRNNLEWRGATHAYLKEAVTRRIDQLNEPPDLATQRLTAEDA
jgi:hypothetical protein